MVVAEAPLRWAWLVVVELIVMHVTRHARCSGTLALPLSPMTLSPQSSTRGKRISSTQSLLPSSLSPTSLWPGPIVSVHEACGCPTRRQRRPRTSRLRPM